MNPKTLWALLLGTGAGAMAQEAESAWAPASLFRAMGRSDVGIDALERLSKEVAKRQVGKRPDSLSRLDQAAFNRRLWDTGEPFEGIKVKPNRYMYDDAGNLQVWVDDHWSKDALANKISEIMTPSDPQFGARMQFQANDLINPNSELASLLPDGGKNLTMRSADVGWDTKGGLLYDPVTGGGRISLSDLFYNPKNLESAVIRNDLAGTADHEITHLLQNLAGEQAGISPDKFVTNYAGIPESLWNKMSDNDMYANTLGERMARAGGDYAGFGTNPFDTLNANQGPSLLPDEFPNRFSDGGYPYRARSYGTPYPHHLDPGAVTDGPVASLQMSNFGKRYNKFGNLPGVMELVAGSFPAMGGQIGAGILGAIDLLMNPPKNQKESSERMLPSMGITAQAALEDPYMMGLFTGE